MVSIIIININHLKNHHAEILAVVLEPVTYIKSTSGNLGVAVDEKAASSCSREKTILVGEALFPVTSLILPVQG